MRAGPAGPTQGVQNGHPEWGFESAALNALDMQAKMVRALPGWLLILSFEYLALNGRVVYRYNPQVGGQIRDADDRLVWAVYIAAMQFSPHG